MKTKNINMKYMCFRQDSNSNQLTWFNILNQSLIEEIKQWKKSKLEYFDISTREKFTQRLKTYFMSRYWSKFEYEVVITNWGKDELNQKIDVFWQISPNLDTIVDIICNAMDIQFNK